MEGGTFAGPRRGQEHGPFLSRLVHRRSHNDRADRRRRRRRRGALLITRHSYGGVCQHPAHERYGQPYGRILVAIRPRKDRRKLGLLGRPWFSATARRHPRHRFALVEREVFPEELLLIRTVREIFAALAPRLEFFPPPFQQTPQLGQ